MQILDYVIIGVGVIGLIVGLIKGLIKQILTLLGVVGITVGTAYLFKFPKQWLSGVIPNDTVLTIVAVVATLIVLSVIYGTIAHFIKKAFKSVKVINVIDKILGMFLGLVVSYAVVAVFVALFTQTGESFLASIRPVIDEQINNSVIVNAVYGNNFFGNWVISVIQSGLATILPQ